MTIAQYASSANPSTALRRSPSAFAGYSRLPPIQRKMLELYSMGTSSRIWPTRVRVPWNATLPTPTSASIHPVSRNRNPYRCLAATRRKYTPTVRVGTEESVLNISATYGVQA